MRLFAALAIPDATAQFVEPLLPEAAEGLRAIPRRRWHLTLAFYGNASVEATACLEQRLERRLQGPGALSLQIRGGGRFGGVAYLSVVGARPQDEANLRALALSCHRAGASCDLPGTSGRFRFRPHITVARARGGGGIARNYLHGLEQVESGGWVATQFQLMTSVLGAVPVYAVRRTFPVPRA